MATIEVHTVLQQLCSELVDGVAVNGPAFCLNAGDVGLLRSLDNLSAAEASQSVHGGATIAAHAQHVCYGLSLLNRWTSEGGNPFAGAQWGEAWKVSHVSEQQWEALRAGLREEAHRWIGALGQPRDLLQVELTGMIASVAHLAYHLGAVRQIAKSARGPKERAS